MAQRVAYSEYLKSPWWRFHVRKQALHRAGFRCEQCGDGDRLDVHHRSYSHLGMLEELDDVEVLCRACHGEQHGIPRPPAPKPGPGSLDYAIEVYLRRKGLTREHWERAKRGDGRAA